MHENYKTNYDKILGRAASFPFKITGGTWPLTQYGKLGQEKHLKQSIQDIVFTIVGERLFRRDYGSLALEMLFEIRNGWL